MSYRRRDIFKTQDAVVAYRALQDRYLDLQVRIAMHRLQFGKYSFAPFFADLAPMGRQLVQLRLRVQRELPNYQL